MGSRRAGPSGAATTTTASERACQTTRSLGDRCRSGSGLHAYQWRHHSAAKAFWTYQEGSRTSGLASEGRGRDRELRYVETRLSGKRALTPSSTHGMRSKDFLHHIWSYQDHHPTRSRSPQAGREKRLCSSEAVHLEQIAASLAEFLAFIDTVGCNAVGLPVQAVAHSTRRKIPLQMTLTSANDQ